MSQQKSIEVLCKICGKQVTIDISACPDIGMIFSLQTCVCNSCADEAERVRKPEIRKQASLPYKDA